MKSLSEIAVELRAVYDNLDDAEYPASRDVLARLADAIDTHAKPAVGETPETDAKEQWTHDKTWEGSCPPSPWEFARQLELQRNEARRELGEWRQHAALSDKEFLQMSDWLIGNAEFEPKTGLIDHAKKLKERIRDLIATEGEVGDMKALLLSVWQEIRHDSKLNGQFRERVDAALRSDSREEAKQTSSDELRKVEHRQHFLKP